MVARTNGGRSFEYLSGEDPFLGYVLVQPVVKSIQSQGVISNVKHWIGNDQEGFVPRKGAESLGDWHTTSAEIDERTQMQLYWPPFEGAVEAGALSMMCANSERANLNACPPVPHQFKRYVAAQTWSTMCTLARAAR
jgi:beta-glucosidase